MENQKEENVEIKSEDSIEALNINEETIKFEINSIKEESDSSSTSDSQILNEDNEENLTGSFFPSIVPLVAKDEVNKYFCEKCEYQTTREEKLMRHKLIVHDGVKYYGNWETKEEENILTNKILKEEKENSGDDIVPSNMDSMESVTPLDYLSLVIKEEKEPNISTNSKKISCICCNEHFQNLQEYSDHISKKHVLQKPKKEEAIATEDHVPKSLFQEDISTVARNNDKKYQCDQCEYQASFMSNLKRHIKIVHEGVLYMCDQCEFQATTRCDIKKHNRSVHEGIRFTCEICEYQFTRKDSLRTHIKNVHEGSRYKCQNCDYKTSWHKSLLQHINEIHGGFQNNNPTKTQSNPCNIRAKIGRPQGVYACTFCDQQCRNNFLLKVHMRVHTGEKPFQCESCGKSFRRRGNLTLHEKIHSGVKDYLCSICSKPFRKSQGLKIHMRTHTQEKLFCCNNCDKSFVDQANFITHTKKYHP